MKKICSFLILSLFTTTLFAQSARLVLNEEFTQVFCSGCIAQNPRFDSLLRANTSKITSVTYQVYWPGVDVMHNDNPTEPDARTTY
jgi:hypothetical protein